MPAWTLALAAALGLGHIVARAAGARVVAGMLKPLPIAVLLGAVLLAEPPGPLPYRMLVAAALVLSMAGDVCLLWKRFFVPGLACFLVAHLLYISAFAQGVDRPGWASAIPFVLFAALVLARLWPHLGRYRAPIAVYVAVITTMGWLATQRAFGGAVEATSARLALVGAVAFMTSDTLLAVNRFARPFRGGDTAVMATYYAAQALLALSAVGVPELT